MTLTQRQRMVLCAALCAGLIAFAGYVVGGEYLAVMGGAGGGVLGAILGA